MKKLLFLILMILTTQLDGQTLEKPKKGQYTEIKIKGSQNTVKVIQGEKVIVYDLDDKKQYDAFAVYLKKIPALARDLHHIEALTKENNHLLKQMLDKSQAYGVFDLSTFLKEYGKIVIENQKLKEEVDVFRKQTNDSELNQLLADANKKLDVFDNEGYQTLLETFKQNRKAKIVHQQHEIAQISYLQAINYRNNYLLKIALEQIDEALLYESNNDKYLFEKGNILNEKGDYTIAIFFYEKALVIEEKLLGKEHLETAITHNNLGLAYDHNGDYTSAVSNLEKALFIQEKFLGKEHSQTAITYNNLGMAHSHKGDFATAIGYYKKALLIFEKVSGKEYQETATTYNNLGIVYNKKGDYSSAIIYEKKALLFNEKVLGKGHPLTANTYSNLGLVYKNTGDYSTAISYFQKALLICEKVLGKEHPTTATIYNNLGLVYYNTDDYATAITYSQKALLIREKILGKEHPSTAITYGNLGLIYTNQEDYTTAISYLEKALFVQEKIIGKEHPETATTYNNLGLVYSNQGDYSTAVSYYEKALFIKEKLLGKIHSSTATIYTNLGLVYLAKGEKEKAIDYLQKAKFNNQTKSEQAKIINQIGVQTSNRNQYEATIKYFTYALELLENGKLAQEEALSIIVYQNLAKTHCFNGNQKQALTFFEKALELAIYAKLDTSLIIRNYNECKRK